MRSSRRIGLVSCLAALLCWLRLQGLRFPVRTYVDFWSSPLLSARRTMPPTTRKREENTFFFNENMYHPTHLLLFHLVVMEGISRAAGVELRVGRAAPLMERWLYHEASIYQPGIHSLYGCYGCFECRVSESVAQRCGPNLRPYVRKSPKRNMKRTP